MKKSKNEILAAVGELIGENADDAALSLLEDIADSYPNEGEVITPDEHKRALEELDRLWRAKYKARFFDGTETVDETVSEREAVDVSDDAEIEVTIEDLFDETN